MILFLLLRSVVGVFVHLDIIPVIFFLYGLLQIDEKQLILSGKTDTMLHLQVMDVRSPFYFSGNGTYETNQGPAVLAPYLSIFR